MQARRSACRAMAVLSTAAAAAMGGCGGQEEGAPATGGAEGDLPARYVVPGDRVFPESIGAQKSTGDFFVGSTTDGTIYRGNVRRPKLEVFLPGGRDGRTAATGVRVREGRLWVGGRFTGRLFVYEIKTRRLLRTYQVPEFGESFSPRRERSLVNDITFAGDAAYVTDSFQPVIYRVVSKAGRPGDLEPWLDLRDTPIAYAKGFNLNGITVSDGQRYLVTVNYRTGELFRIDVKTRKVLKIDLGGAEVRTGDGLLLDGTTLLVVREEPGEIQPVKLSENLLRGTLGRPFGRSRLRLPTAMFELGGRGYVVNSQLDRGQNPKLPFTVEALPIPKGTLRGRS
jgi:hypothetical protein